MTAKLGEMLVSLSACPPEAVQEALHSQCFFGGRLGTNLLLLGAVDEETLARVLARIHRVPCISGEIVADPRAIALVPREMAERHEVVPWQLVDRTLRVVMCDPRNLPAIDDIGFATGKRVEPVIAPEARVWSLLRESYGIERGLRAIGDEEKRRWAPRLYRVPGFARPVADDVW